MKIKSRSYRGNTTGNQGYRVNVKSSVSPLSVLCPWPVESEAATLQNPLNTPLRPSLRVRSTNIKLVVLSLCRSPAAKSFLFGADRLPLLKSAAVENVFIIQ